MGLFDSIRRVGRRQHLHWVAHRDDGEKLKKTLSRADVALYKAKKDGRNKVILYFPS